MNCKPGDLAIVVRAHCPENIGLLVEVLNRGYYCEYEGWTWLTVCSHKAPRIEGSRSRFGYCPDSTLRPIRPGDISDEEVRDLYAPKLPETTHV